MSDSKFQTEKPDQSVESQEHDQEMELDQHRKEHDDRVRSGQQVFSEEGMTSWSLVKEAALRRLVAQGVPYSDALTKLSDIKDEDVDGIFTSPHGRDSTVI